MTTIKECFDCGQEFTPEEKYPDSELCHDCLDIDKTNMMEQFHKACQNIVDHKDMKAVNWAVNYARYGLTITDIDEAKVQTLYILNNITSWRGDVAKETRAILKSIK